MLNIQFIPVTFHSNIVQTWTRPKTSGNTHPSSTRIRVQEWCPCFHTGKSAPNWTWKAGYTAENTPYR